MTLPRSELSALVGSRICHDLISPLGAIGNGLELLSMTGAATPDGPEMELIAQSVDSANARVRFFRIAFGAASADQRIARSELEGLLDDSYRLGRITMDTSLPTDILRRDAKLALLLILCLETALPRGGVITLQASDQTWRLRAEADRVAVEARLWEQLTEIPGEGANLSASEVQFALLPESARQAGRALAVNLGPEAIEVRF